MLKSVFFDIDNTLILFNENLFFKSYMPLISEYFADLFPDGDFQTRLIQATCRLSENDGEKTNAEYFMDHFTGDMNLDRNRVWERFLSFYQTRFESLKSRIEPVEGCSRTIQRLKHMGLRLVAASNPVWPLSVQVQRLRWAGLDPDDFELIAHIENSSYCKPHTGFYRDLCLMMNLDPGEAMMAGNDPVNDMAAGGLGMKTFLTHDALDVDASLHMSRSIRPDEETAPPLPDFEGLLSSVPDAVSRLLSR